MNSEKDIRWRQRYSNLEKAYQQLAEGVEAVDELSDIGKEGLVQRFEYTFELAWKTMKDYLESKGEEALFVRDVLKKSFHLQIIKNGEIWIDMLEKRNLLAHTYDENNFNQAIKYIVKVYFKEITQVVNFFRNISNK